MEDCNDEDDTIHPFATDIPGDGVDQDCDGNDQQEACYVDEDGDGFGSSELPVPADDPLCTAVGGVTAGGDCNDGDGAIHPNADEIAVDGVDQNCDGVELCFEDGDGDGFGGQTTVEGGQGDLLCAGAGVSFTDTDCDDGDDAIHPDGEEIAGDGVDQDCDGVELCHVDGDGDGFGSEATVEAEAGDLLCAGTGVSPNDTDCDDDHPGVNPDADERVADGQDRDCDGREICYVDSDHDGYGTDATALSEVGDVTCSATGVSTFETDCDDTDPDIYPTATEIPADGVDQDCDNRELCYVDTDLDGFGSVITTTTTAGDLTCSAVGLSGVIGDCDDTDGAIHPDAIELPVDGVDQNCDDHEICYIDGDSDGYGTDATTLSAVGDLTCSATDVSIVSTDCNDGNADIRPGVLEIFPDTVDNDCDGLTDVVSFQFSDDEFVNPRIPVVNATNRHYLLHVTTDQRIGDTVATNVGTTDRFPIGGDPTGGPDKTLTWEGASGSYPLGGGLHSLADGERFYNITSYQRELTTGQGPELRTYLRFHRYEWNDTIQKYLQQTQFHYLVTDDLYLDFDIAILDDGTIQGIGCGNRSIHYMNAENNVAGQFKALWYFAKDFRDASFTYAVGHACIIEPRPFQSSLVWAFNDGTERDGVRAHAFTLEVMDIPLDPTATTWDGYGVYDANRHHASEVITFAGGDTAVGGGGTTVDTGLTVERLLISRVARSADARVYNGKVVVAAVVDDITGDGINDVVLAYGNPSTFITEVILPFEHPTLDLEPEGVSLHVDANRIFVGVSGINTGSGNDGVGWLFLGNGL